MAQPKQITLRNVPPRLSERLKLLSQYKGESLNTTVIQLLEKSVGVDERRERLLRYATWTPQDLKEFDDALAAQRTIDAKLWK